MRVAPGAVLAPLHPLRVLPLVLIREEVTVFALGAFQNDLVSRQCSFLWLPAERRKVGTAEVLTRSVVPPFRRSSYFKILVTTPAPTVRPPSRMAKRSPSSIAIGVISSIVICTLSPGITISTPAGSSTLPVTSVVRK